MDPLTSLRHCGGVAVLVCVEVIPLSVITVMGLDLER